MSDLIAQIRERLDGWAPVLREHGLPLDMALPAAFAALPDGEPMSPAEIEARQKQWDELLGDSSAAQIRILPPGPRFYPGFDEMRAAILAVLKTHAPWEVGHPDGPDYVCQTCRYFTSDWPCPTVYDIATELGIDCD